MKHLKRYNENLINGIIDLKEIEELFYPLSDEHYLNVTVTKERARYIRFDKPIMYLGKSVYNFKNDNIAYVLAGDMANLPFHQTIRVLITKSPIISHSIENKPMNKMDITTFVDELKFPIDYLEQEKGLKLKQLWASRQGNYGNDYPNYLYYKDLDALVGDDILGKSMLSLVLYFGN